MSSRQSCVRTFVAAATVTLCPAHANQALTSFLPKSGLERFIADKFDIGTIRSSLGPRSAPGQVHFGDLGIRPRSIGAGHIELQYQSGWTYDITVLGRGDMNNDGIEDVVVCFSDNGRGAGGTYFDIQSLLLTKYSKNSPLVAISYKPNKDPRCKETDH